MTAPRFPFSLRRRAKHDVRLPLVAAVLFACLAAAGSLAPATASPARNSAPYRLIQVGRIAPGPADWVAQGHGLLVYGSGARVVFAPESAPSSPVARLTLNHPVSGGLILADVACLVQNGQGLRFFRLSDPAHPQDLGSFPLPPGRLHVVQWGDDLLVAADGYGLKVLAADPGFFMDMGTRGCGISTTAPALKETAFLPMRGTFTALAASGNTAYVAVKNRGIEMVDLSAPESPVLAGRIPFRGTVAGLAADGNRGLIASGPSYVRLLRGIAEGKAPSVAGGLALSARDLLLEGRAIYAAAGAGGVLLLRTDSPEASTADVNVGNIFFNPATVSINAGDAVKWTWVGGTHSSTSGSCATGNCTPDGTWDSGLMSSGTFSHTFATAGKFPYFCRIHLAAMTGEVDVAGSAALAASASASPTSGAPPLTVSFTGGASGGTPPYSYSWDFGDGSAASTAQNPAHTYTNPGTYAVTFTVHDSAGGEAQDTSVSIAVTAPGALSASASASPTTGQAPLAVAFTGSASGGTAPYSYAWSFGDGSSSTAQNPAHTYAAAGSYPVTLTVTDSASATATDNHLAISVSAVPPPVVSGVSKMGAPFRLKVEGSGFVSGCAVKINGQSAPATKFKRDSLVIAKGGKALKAMVPKGQTVTITVVNPDGSSSQGFSFSWTASGGGGGGS